MVCSNRNVYESTKKLSKSQYKKFKICEKLLNIPIVYYTDIIEKSDEIYIIDSCFTGIILPYLKTGRLKARKVRIIRREMVSSVKLH